MITFSSRFLIAAPLVGVFAFGAYSMGETSLPQSVRVSYADLNLDTPQGLDVLYRRITQAAQKVCASRQISGTRIDHKYRSCVQGATDHALTQVRWPPSR